MLQFLPYLAAAYGGYKGYQGAKDAGGSGLERILGGITGAYTGYTLGSSGMALAPQSAATKAFAASQPQILARLPGAYNAQSSIPGMIDQSNLPPSMRNANLNAAQKIANQNRGGSLLDILRVGGGADEGHGVHGRASRRAEDGLRQEDGAGRADARGGGERGGDPGGDPEGHAHGVEDRHDQGLRDERLRLPLQRCARPLPETPRSVSTRPPPPETALVRGLARL